MSATTRPFAALLLCLAAALAVAACAREEDLDPGASDSDALAAPPVPMVAWEGIPRPEIAEVLLAHPDGLQIAEDQVAFDDGKVVLTIPARSAPPAAVSYKTVHGCPSGWYCFYDAYNFGGRKLQFRDCSNNGTRQRFSDYGFNNLTTSWVVNRSVDVIGVDNQLSSIGFQQLWTEHSYSSSSNVGTANNDKADEFTCWL